MAVAVKNLTKIYGLQAAVDDVSFAANSGEILGFLGPNGAGKSTTMKVATTYIPPTLGSIEVDGFDVVKEPLQVRARVGYLPEHNPLYLDMYVHEYLGFVGSLYGLKGKKLKGRVAEMIDLCGLSVEQNKLIGALSKGYRQRVGLAQALIHDPSVLILDEPTTGLDPNQIIEIRNLIKRVSVDKTVIFSSHIMQEVKALCDRVVIINQGKIVADETVDQLQADSASTMSLKVQFQKKPLLKELNQLDGVIEVEATDSLEFLIKTNQDVRTAVFNFAVRTENVILGMQQHEYSLEKVFRELTNSQPEV